MPLKHTPIQRKLMVIFLLTTMVAMALTCAVFFGYEFLTFRAATFRQLSTVGEVIAANSTAALAFDNQNDAREILAALKTEPHITAAALYDKTGKLFVTYPAGMPEDSLPAAPEKEGYHFKHLSLSGFQPVVQGDRFLGTLFLRLDTGFIMRHWFRNSIGIAFGTIAIALWVAYLISKTLQKQISQPILSLARTARAISERGDYSVRAQKMGEDELGLLTDAFNDMLSQIHEQNQALSESEARVRNLNAELEQRVVERTAQLQTANKELEAFSYSVSHDLRAPLRHVMGFVQLLQREAGSSLSEKALSYLTTISEAAKRMGNLIDDLLSFSHVGRTALQKAEVNLDELVRETLGDFQEETKQRHIAWEIHPLPAVWVDRALLRMVLVNLISNAVKFTGARAQAKIEIGCVPGGSQETVIFIRDNGAGFDPRYASKLFGVFQRLHSQSEFEGTGIGLANVQRIIYRHGGRTWAEGVVDGGATLYFSIPTKI